MIAMCLAPDLNTRPYSKADKTAFPQRAVRPKPTTAPGKSTAARRVFAESAAWRRCSAVTDRYGYDPLSRLAIQLILRKQRASEFSGRL
jgi:hypothetical protein